MRIFKEVPNIKFMKARIPAFVISGVIILIGIILFFTKGFNMAIDFTGGTSIDVAFREKINVSQVRSALSQVGLGKSVIQQMGNQNRFLIKAALDERERKNFSKSQKTEDTQEVSIAVEKALLSQEENSFRNANKIDLNNAPFGEISAMLIKSIPREIADETAHKIEKIRKENHNGLITSFDQIEKSDIKRQAITPLKDNGYLGRFTFLSVESIGPQVGKDMRSRATLATIWSLIGMLIYIAFRFRFLNGVSGMLTLLHDTLVTLTFILVFQIEFSLSVLAAILTLIGYSINDTIVIFDRLRDNLTIMKRDKLEDIMDASINQTLSRTIITAGTVFLTVVALFFFGGEVIHGFAATLLVGVIAGSYSTIYQSCAWLLVWEKKYMQTAIKKK